MSALLGVLLLSPFISAPILLALGRRFGARVGWLALAAPLTSFAACVGLCASRWGRSTTISWDWVPRLDVQLTFMLDGLSLFFGLMVTGIGCLITFYSAHYLGDEYRRHGQFYCFLQSFMGAMLATVFSSNLLLLYTAWELTGVTSFFLIGFLHDSVDSQRGARMALLTTAGTGLVLLVGIVLLQQIFGTFELSFMLDAPVPASKAGLLTPAFLCCFVGICGKSALLPFHYWLPNAMAAPTPVSAYLHSATMVKLGIFLTARLAPLFVETASWTPSLLAVGFLTFVLGSFLAWLSHDLKAVLAFTTVAQLGLLAAQYGWASRQGPLFGDLLHVANHSLYKASLFMVVGIIDHSTSTRDIRRLGGLFSKMPLTGSVALVGLATMAGLPLTTGFVSKELLLEASFDFQSQHSGLWSSAPLLAFAVGSVLHGLVALRIAKNVFFGATPPATAAVFHSPSAGIQLAPLLLAAAALYFGVRPHVFGSLTAWFSDSAVPVSELHLWPGWTRAALGSAGILTTAGLLFVLGERFEWQRWDIPRALRFDRGFARVVEAIPALGARLNRMLGFERPSAYLLIVASVMVAGVFAAAVSARGSLGPLLPSGDQTPQTLEEWGRWGVVLLIAAGTLLAARWKQPIPQVFAVSVVGLAVSFYYVLYRAPDLALTQLLVEAATLLLVLVVVLRFKRDAADQEQLQPVRPVLRAARVVVSVGAGLLLGAAVLIFQNPDLEHAGQFYLDQTLALAHGANAVNTIVVDFRGFDTMLEITVLLIAALGSLGLLARPSERPHLDRHPLQVDLFPVPRDFILKAVALGTLVPLNVFSLYVFVRGHDAPGGGFVAGLITALSLTIVNFVIGLERFRKLLRIDPLSLAVAGILLALCVALLPLVAFDLSPLHHLYMSLGPVSVGTPLLFDTGVFLTVVGVTLKLIFPLMKSVHGLPAFVREEEGIFMAAGNEPIDFDPERHRSSVPEDD